MKITQLVLACAISSIIIGCNISNTNNGYEPDFFPTDINAFWQYEMTYVEADTMQSNFPYPTNFKTRISEKIERWNSTLLRVDGYFLPGPYLGDTLRLITNNDGVRVYIDDEDYIFYSFTEIGKTWSIPFFVNKTSGITHNYWATLVISTEDKLIVRWSDKKDPNVSHLIWEDHFEKGIGRVKIVVYGQAYGKTIWELTDTNIQLK